MMNDEFLVAILTQKYSFTPFFFHFCSQQLKQLACMVFTPYFLIYTLHFSHYTLHTMHYTLYFLLFTFH